MTTEPRPSVKEMQDMLASELSGGSRWVYTLLLIFDLLVAAAVGSLWLTEPTLPIRTSIAFGGILSIALAWIVALCWTLFRKKVLLARHKLVMSRLAVLGTGAFMFGALILGPTTPSLRSVALTAAVFGAVLFAVALILWHSASRRFEELADRTRTLQNKLSSTASSVLLMALVGWATIFVPGDVIAQQISPAPIEMRVVGAPVPVPALGRQHLVYELHLTLFGLEPRRVESLAVLDGVSGDVLGSWSGDKLASRMQRVGLGPRDAKRTDLLEPGVRTVVYLWLTMNPGSLLPGSLKHQLTTVDSDGENSHVLHGEALSLDTPELPMAHSPVDEGTWIAVRGPSNSSGHRRSLVALDGSARISQRFAVDWAMLGEDGRMFSSDGTSNDDWYGYGKSVLASRQGRIVHVKTGIPDHAPLSPEAANFAERETATGNTVVVDEGNGRFAVYAHLRPGSIKVREGDSVAEGALLGQIGNSGHSLAPHLHYHVGDRPDPLASEGLPFVLDSFRLLGRIDSLRAAISGSAWTPDPRRPARDVEGEIPFENMVIRFE